MRDKLDDALIVAVLAYLATTKQDWKAAISGVASSIIEDEAATAAVQYGEFDASGFVDEWVQLMDPRMGVVALTTLKRIDAFLRAHIGESTQSVLAELAVLFSIFDTERAPLIARYETQSATNFAIWKSISTVGMRFKRWLSMLDGKVRDSHQNVHGQLRAIGEPFDVGGEQLMYPGDPGGSAGEVINCRCYLIPDQGERSVWSKFHLRNYMYGYAIRSSAWEDRMLAVVRGQFVNQHAAIVSIFHTAG